MTTITKTFRIIKKEGRIQFLWGILCLVTAIFDIVNLMESNGRSVYVYAVISAWLTVISIKTLLNINTYLKIFDPELYAIKLLREQFLKEVKKRS